MDQAIHSCVDVLGAANTDLALAEPEPDFVNKRLNVSPVYYILTWTFSLSVVTSKCQWMDVWIISWCIDGQLICWCKQKWQPRL